MKMETLENISKAVENANKVNNLDFITIRLKSSEAVLYGTNFDVNERNITLFQNTSMIGIIPHNEIYHIDIYNRD